MQLTSSYDFTEDPRPPGGTFQTIMSTSSLLLKMKSLVFACILTCLTRSAYAGTLFEQSLPLVLYYNHNGIMAEVKSEGQNSVRSKVTARSHQLMLRSHLE